MNLKVPKKKGQLYDKTLGKCVTKMCCYRHKGVRGKKDELHPLVCVTKNANKLCK